MRGGQESDGKISPRFPGAGQVSRAGTWTRPRGLLDAALQTGQPSSTLGRVGGTLLKFTVAPSPRSTGPRRLGPHKRGGEGRCGDAAAAERGLPARAAGRGPPHTALGRAPQGLGRAPQGLVRAGMCAGHPRRSRPAAGRAGQIRGRLRAPGAAGPRGRRHLPQGPAGQVCAWPRASGPWASNEVTPRPAPAEPRARRRGEGAWRPRSPGAPCALRRDVSEAVGRDGGDRSAALVSGPLSSA